MSIQVITIGTETVAVEKFEFWEATSELRWKQPSRKHNIHPTGYNMYLQQKWRSNMGNEKWENIPLSMFDEK